MLEKFIVFSDLHLHTWAYGAHTRKDGYNSRLYAQYQSLMEIEKYALEHGVKHIFFCGDMFHTHSNIPTQVLSIATAAFTSWAKNGLQLHALVGNHDMADQLGEIHSLGWMAPIAHVIDQEETFEIDGTAIHAMPYTENPEKLNKFLARSPEDSIVLLHQGVDSTLMGSGFVMNEIFDIEKVPSRVKSVWTGHYHSPSTFMTSRDKPLVRIPGSLMEHTWADFDGKLRGFNYVDFNDTDKYPEFIHTKSSPQFIAFSTPPFSGEFNEKEFISNKFVRVLNFDPKDVNDIREFLFEKGAVSVEFVLTSGTDGPIGSQSVNPSNDQDFSIEPLLQEYEKMQLPKRRHELGRIVREKKEYELP